MRIEQLEYTVEIAKTGSITLAAESLKISQPSLSQAISSLEEELGIKIFKRSKIGTHLTEHGKEIVIKAQEVLNKMNELIETANLQQSLIAGRLSIASAPSICQSILPKALISFKKKYPSIELEIMEGDSPKIIKHVMDEKVDIGILAEFSNYGESNKYLLYEKIFKNKIMACVGKHSPFANKTSISLNEIFQNPVICTSKALINFLNKYGQPNYLFKSSNLEGAKNIITHGIATGFYTEASLKIDPYVSSGQIIPLEITDAGMNEVSYSLIQLKTNQSIASKEFKKEIKDQAIIFKRLYGL
ncbi:LysR family transcriptional regulator [Neobacillus bataviensis LMG 21833]|uniref:LysR family transcriptional regulator n=1 Tax=Neobacillus bataviensis LMG 21833 TaxID=1117379 RepID=K6DDP0_9BACI|nr:LysR family transcriptional regulator [Neobacillus bataviensis]EKN70637.1 LysR family transcriptional regulator [Neobacillus bataviensis LMG 21833]